MKLLPAISPLKMDGSDLNWTIYTTSGCLVSKILSPKLLTSILNWHQLWEPGLSKVICTLPNSYSWEICKTHFCRQAQGDTQYIDTHWHTAHLTTVIVKRNNWGTCNSFYFDKLYFFYILCHPVPIFVTITPIFSFCRISQSQTIALNTTITAA